MIDRADTVAAYGLIAAGIIHTSLALPLYPERGEGALWFAGAGLALGLLGLINIARRAAPRTPVRQISAVANLVSLPYMLLICWTLRAPHVFLVLGMLLVASICSLYTPAPERAVLQ